MGLGAWSRTMRSGVLAERDPRVYLAGYLASMIGTGITPVALTFAVLENGGRASQVGAVLAAETGPLVVLLLVGGVVADRLPRRTVLVASDLVSAASQAVLALLLFRGTPALWQLMVCAGVLGAGLAFHSPAQTGIIPEITSAGRLQEANALLGVARSSGVLIGAAVGGIVVAAAGAGWGIAADALSFAVSAACVAQVRIAARPRDDTGANFVRELRLGWDEFRSRTWLWVIVVQFAFMHAMVFAPFMVLGAVTADDHFGGAAAWGAILACDGCGAVAGGLLVMRRRFHHPLRVATIATTAPALSLVALATRAPLLVNCAAAAIGGVGIAIFGTLWQTTMHEQIDDAVLSRVSAYDWFGSVALFPVGYALVGPISARLGVGGTLWLAAVWLVVGNAAVLLVKGVTDMCSLDRPGMVESDGRRPVAAAEEEGR